MVKLTGNELLAVKEISHLLAYLNRFGLRSEAQVKLTLLNSMRLNAVVVLKSQARHHSPQVLAATPLAHEPFI